MSNTNPYDKLIDDLAEDLCPVSPLHHPLIRALIWMVVSSLYIAGAVFFAGMRTDLAQKTSDVSFIFEMSLALLITVSSVLASTWWAVPDVREKKWIVSIPLISTLIFIFWNGLRFFIEEKGNMPPVNWGDCIKDGLIMGLGPFALILLLARKGATCCSTTMCSMNILSVTGLAYIGLRLTCGTDTVGQGCITHILPFLILAVIMGAIARRVYKW